MAVVPQAFVEYELRIYDKRSRAERKKSHQKALEWALILLLCHNNYAYINDS